MIASSFVLTSQARAIVDATILEVCTFRNWRLHALNVRTNHVHVVVSADVEPSKLLHDFKAWPTRRLVEAGLIARGYTPWARHGSTRYINTPDSLAAAIDYVLNQQ